ncbi:MerR family DNA-binding protein, partial [Vibrio parahaemolyticus]
AADASLKTPVLNRFAGRSVKQAQTAGFTLAEIAELIDLDRTDDRPRARDMARERIAALDEHIAQLTA